MAVTSAGGHGGGHVGGVTVAVTSAGVTMAVTSAGVTVAVTSAVTVVERPAVLDSRTCYPRTLPPLSHMGSLAASLDRAAI